MAAVCIERRPIITPVRNEMQEGFQKLLSKLEFENSLKSAHEMRHEADLRLAKVKSTKDIDIDLVAQQTAQDYEDAGMEEVSKFKFASRIMRADEKNETDAINRKLDKHLFLLVENRK